MSEGEISKESGGEGGADAGISVENSAETEVEAALQPRFRLAFERILPELRAIPAEEVGTINLDVQAAVTTVLDLVEGIRGVREDVVKIVHPTLDISAMDRIEEFTMALGHAHGVFLVASEKVVSPEELAKEAIEVRRTLNKDADALVQRKLLDEERLKAVRSRMGYRNIGFDLLAFAALFREHWVTINGRTGLTLQELEEFETLGEELVAIAGKKALRKVSRGEAADHRNRAFRMFIRAYDEIQRLVGFARWHKGDADEIAPSLYAGNTGGSKQEPETVETSETPDETAGGAPAQPPIASVHAAATQSSSAVTAESASSAPIASKIIAGLNPGNLSGPSVREGFPGGSPLIDEE